jgi:hypothetical protein
MTIDDTPVTGAYGILAEVAGARPWRPPPERAARPDERSQIIGPGQRPLPALGSLRVAQKSATARIVAAAFSQRRGDGVHCRWLRRAGLLLAGSFAGQLAGPGSPGWG